MAQSSTVDPRRSRKRKERGPTAKFLHSVATGTRLPFELVHEKLTRKENLEKLDEEVFKALTTDEDGSMGAHISLSDSRLTGWKDGAKFPALPTPKCPARQYGVECRGLECCMQGRFLPSHPVDTSHCRIRSVVRSVNGVPRPLSHSVSTVGTEIFPGLRALHGNSDRSFGTTVLTLARRVGSESQLIVDILTCVREVWSLPMLRVVTDEIRRLLSADNNLTPLTSLSVKLTMNPSGAYMLKDSPFTPDQVNQYQLALMQAFSRWPKYGCVNSSWFTCHQLEDCAQARHKTLAGLSESSKKLLETALIAERPFWTLARRHFCSTPDAKYVTAPTDERAQYSGITAYLNGQAKDTTPTVLPYIRRVLERCDNVDEVASRALNLMRDLKTGESATITKDDGEEFHRFFGVELNTSREIYQWIVANSLIREEGCAALKCIFGIIKRCKRILARETDSRQLEIVISPKPTESAAFTSAFDLAGEGLEEDTFVALAGRMFHVEKVDDNHDAEFSVLLPNGLGFVEKQDLGEVVSFTYYTALCHVTVPPVVPLNDGVLPGKKNANIYEAVPFKQHTGNRLLAGDFERFNDEELWTLLKSGTATYENFCRYSCFLYYSERTRAEFLQEITDETIDTLGEERFPDRGTWHGRSAAARGIFKVLRG